MAVPNPPLPVLRFAGLLAADETQLAAAQRELTQWYGAIDDQTQPMPFTFTDYYADQMGHKLLRQWVRFANLFAPEQLAKCKLDPNMAEILLARQFPQAAKRPVNIDPGYLTRTKIILATTKDHSHRVYLSEGIYSEVTLHWNGSRWIAWPWTYPDYQSDLAQSFFVRAREAYFSALQRKLSLSAG